MKKVLALVLALAMVLSVVACSGSTTSTATTTETTTTTEAAADGTASEVNYYNTGITDRSQMPTIQVLYCLTSIPSGQQRIEDAINDLCAEKYGIQVELCCLEYAAYNQQLNLIMAGDEGYDIAFIWASVFSTFVANDSIKDVTEYADTYLKDAVAANEGWLGVGEISGKLYAFPRINMMATGNGYLFRKDLIEKYNIDLSTVKTEADLTAIFETVSAGEPGMIMVGSERVSSTTYEGMVSIGTYDGLSDNLGVLADPTSTTVSNYYESEAFAESCRLHRQWNQAGYIWSDMATTDTVVTDYMASGQLFCYQVGWKPGVVTEHSTKAKTELVGVQLGEALCQTAQAGSMLWCIPEQCDETTAALIFLNAMYCDADLLNLLAWGQEGTDYVVTEGNQIDFPEGVTAATAEYYHGWDFAFGNSLLTHVMAPTAEDMRQQLQDYCDASVKSAALGFTPDSSSYANEMGACQSVQAKYVNALTCGFIDYDENIDAFNDALYAAGLQNIIDAKQAQINEWAAANGK